MNAVLTTDNLKEIAGLHQATALRAWLNSQNIRFFESKNGPWTTLSLVDAAKGLVNGQDLGSKQTEDLL